MNNRFDTAPDPERDPWLPHDPNDRPPAECRSIAITDEIRAQDAAERESREKLPETAWPIKASLSVENLKREPRKPKVVAKPARPKTAARVRKQRDLKLPADGLVAVRLTPPATLVKVLKEDGMDKVVAKRECAVVGCEKLVGPGNASGRCSAHWFLKIGTKLKDGSVWSGNRPAAPKVRTAQLAVRKAAVKPAKVGKRPVVISADQEEPMVQISVPGSFLDKMLCSLSVADKARIVEQELKRGVGGHA